MSVFSVILAKETARNAFSLAFDSCSIAFTYHHFLKSVPKISWFFKCLRLKHLILKISRQKMVDFYMRQKKAFFPLCSV